MGAWRGAGPTTAPAGAGRSGAVPAAASPPHRLFPRRAGGRLTPWLGVLRPQALLVHRRRLAPAHGVGRRAPRPRQPDRALPPGLVARVRHLRRRPGRLVLRRRPVHLRPVRQTPARLTGTPPAGAALDPRPRSEASAALRGPGEGAKPRRGQSAPRWSCPSPLGSSARKARGAPRPRPVVLSPPEQKGTSAPNPVPRATRPAGRGRRGWRRWCSTRRRICWRGRSPSKGS